MTSAIAQRPRDAAGTRLITHSAAERVRNVVSMTRRNLVHISREPMQLSDVTIQPVLFTVLFITCSAARFRSPVAAATPISSWPGCSR
jgi:hypothetical protein